MKTIRRYNLFLFIVMSMCMICDAHWNECCGFNGLLYAQTAGDSGENFSDRRNGPEDNLTASDDDGSSSKDKKQEKARKVVFNFDNADLIEVIRTLAEILEINYMVEPRIGGKVTIHTAGELNRDDLFEVFFQILELNGLTAVRQDKIYRITSLKDAPRLPVTARVGKDLTVPPEERVVIQVVSLNFVSPKEVVKIITPFVSPEAVVIAEENTNILVVVDKEANLSKIVRLINVFDTDIFEKFQHRFYSLKYSDPEELSEIIQKMLSSYGKSIESGVNLIPVSRLNTLLVISANPQVFDRISSFIKSYDVPSERTAPGIYFYPLKNGRVEDISEILNKVFTGKRDVKAGKEASAKSSPFENPFAAKPEKKDSEAPSPAGEVTSGAGDSFVSSGTLRGDVRITADASRNSLIIEATPSDYQIIKNLLKQLDVMPRQVLIEVTFAEITLDESTSMGVEWSYKKGAASLSTSLVEATMGDSGLNFTIGNPDRWSAALSALATENKVNILSSPSVMASNSMPANIDISQEIPIASSQYQYTTGDDPLLETEIEYRDTGIMLSVTPNINEQGLVTMEINQEISEQSTNVSVGGKDYPSFFKRSTDTTLTVQSGQTIVIGGLIRETQSDGVSGTPWFTNIPILSFLFGQTSDSVSKTELVILISPYVIATPDDVDAVTREFKNKISSLSLNTE